jgi:hypothetical protein
VSVDASVLELADEPATMDTSCDASGFPEENSAVAENKRKTYDFASLASTSDGIDNATVCASPPLALAVVEATVTGDEAEVTSTRTTRKPFAFTAP